MSNEKIKQRTHKTYFFFISTSVLVCVRLIFACNHISLSKTYTMQQ